MRTWLQANGGPLALVVLGLGIGGFTSRIVGLSLIVGGIAWFLLPPLTRGPSLLRPSPGLTVEFEHAPHWVAAIVTRHGSSLRNAAIQFRAPFIVIGRKEHRTDAPGTQIVDRENGIFGWDEQHIEITGGATPRRLEFHVVGPPFGQSELRLRIYDDSLGRPIELKGEIHVPVPDSLHRSRVQTFNSVRETLERNRYALSRLLASGYFWPADEVWLRASPNLSGLDGWIDPRVYQLCNDAFAETSRISGLIRPTEPIRPEDHIPRALAVVLQAVVAMTGFVE